MTTLLADIDRPARPSPRAVLTPSVLAIGASTGGPQALVTLVAGLARFGTRTPICVTLHMPRDLMPVIAAHVARRCDVETCVVDRPRPLSPGVIHFAPGDRHIGFRRVSCGCELTLLPSPSRDYCRPAVDVMFKEAAQTFGPRVLAVVLSGMGKDGLEGAEAVVTAGGCVLVQSQRSSAVWGMPGAVAKAGLATAALPPAELAVEVARRLEPVRLAPAGSP